MAAGDWVADLLAQNISPPCAGDLSPIGNSMMKASSTKVFLRLPLEKAIPIAQASTLSKESFFGYVATRISRELSLNAMSMDLSANYDYVAIGLKLPLAQADKLRQACRKERLSAGDWLRAQLLAPPGSPSAGRDLSPINSLAPSAPTDSATPEH